MVGTQMRGDWKVRQVWNFGRKIKTPGALGYLMAPSFEYDICFEKLWLQQQEHHSTRATSASGSSVSAPITSASIEAALLAGAPDEFGVRISIWVRSDATTLLFSASASSPWLTASDSFVLTWSDHTELCGCMVWYKGNSYIQCHCCHTHQSAGFYTAPLVEVTFGIRILKLILILILKSLYTPSSWAPTLCIVIQCPLTLLAPSTQIRIIESTHNRIKMFYQRF